MENDASTIQTQIMTVKFDQLKIVGIKNGVTRTQPLFRSFEALIEKLKNMVQFNLPSFLLKTN